ncbi:MAG: hypothetical protein JWO02_2666 [Solirubrobacterales bacterium]|nr:hypothetical protein [Solirubrobacterales bacterium]
MRTAGRRGHDSIEGARKRTTQTNSPSTTEIEARTPGRGADYPSSCASGPETGSHCGRAGNPGPVPGLQLGSCAGVVVVGGVVALVGVVGSAPPSLGDAVLVVGDAPPSLVGVVGVVVVGVDGGTVAVVDGVVVVPTVSVLAVRCVGVVDLTAAESLEPHPAAVAVATPRTSAARPAVRRRVVTRLEGVVGVRGEAFTPPSFQASAARGTPAPRPAASCSSARALRRPSMSTGRSGIWLRSATIPKSR